MELAPSETPHLRLRRRSRRQRNPGQSRHRRLSPRTLAHLQPVHPPLSADSKCPKWFAPSCVPVIPWRCPRSRSAAAESFGGASFSLREASASPSVYTISENALTCIPPQPWAQVRKPLSSLKTAGNFEKRSLCRLIFWIRSGRRMIPTFSVISLTRKARLIDIDFPSQ